MKKLLLLCLMMLAVSQLAMSQAPYKFNYQAIVHDAEGNIVSNQSVSLRISILEGSASGTVAFSEEHTTETNQQGLVTIHIGDGNSQEGSLSSIDWGKDAHFIQIEMDPDGDGSFQLAGTSQLLSVPYALHAQSTSHLSSTGTDTLFVVKDTLGNPVFAVFPDGAKVYVNETPAKKKLGGFAVSGRGSTKSEEYSILEVTPDSTRIFFNENLQAKKKLGGFAVSGRGSAKASANRLMDITPDNYFIGENAGASITDGLHNSFLGYQAGMNTTIGSNNLFFGHLSGYNNTEGNSNIFIGNQTGYHNDSDDSHIWYSNNNIFIGDLSGYHNTKGYNNVFIGTHSGFSNDSANYNISIGYRAGYTNYSGIQQVFIGDRAGEMTTGRMNTLVGAVSGANNTSGANNCFLGSVTGTLSITASNNTFIGNQSGFRQQIGDEAQSYNTFMGSRSGYSNEGNIGAYNVGLGYSAGYRNGNNLGDYNVFIGPYAGYDVAGSNQLIIAGGYNNEIITGDFASLNLSIYDNLCINGASYENKLNIYSGIDANGATNGISFVESGTLSMKIGYDGSSNGDNNRIHFYSTSENPLLTIENGGNVGVSSSDPTNLFEVGFAYCDGNTWTNSSDRNLKENFTQLDYSLILKGIEQLDITRWNFKNQPVSVHHIGPMAQDFYHTFKLGSSNKTIATTDLGGISLAGIKALILENNNLKNEMNDLKSKYQTLEEKQNQLIEELTKLKNSIQEQKD